MMRLKWKLFFYEREMVVGGEGPSLMGATDLDC